MTDETGVGIRDLHPKKTAGPRAQKLFTRVLVVGAASSPFSNGGRSVVRIWSTGEKIQEIWANIALNRGKAGGTEKGNLSLRPSAAWGTVVCEEFRAAKRCASS